MAHNPHPRQDPQPRQGTKRPRIVLNAPVVLAFVAVCTLATLAGQLTGGAITRLLFSTYASSPLNPLTYLRLLTHVAGHGGWEHLLANMTYILLLGPLLEEKYGSKTLLEVIAITAVVTGLDNNLFFPHQILCGASGVCFAFILLSSLTDFREGEIPLTFLLVAAIYLGQEVVLGILVRDDVSNLSHIIGGIVGAASGFVLTGRARARRAVR